MIQCMLLQITILSKNKSFVIYNRNHFSDSGSKPKKEIRHTGKTT